MKVFFWGGGRVGESMCVCEISWEREGRGGKNRKG